MAMGNDTKNYSVKLVAAEPPPLIRTVNWEGGPAWTQLEM